ncbi:glycosyltransferase family 2 protein [Aureibaculum luteum]|uniref:glycosyltransferase family 2 protein n=1 Tax=Aureibaculum luteum TaxID=1548456 RepID=UPI000E4DC4A7|nr:glycosyltransferase family 2 protein [Aureibaculum luteum]
MNFIIPMAGHGKRFKKAGYKIPKYLIEVKNKKLLQYSLESLPLELATNIVFIALKEHQEEFNIKEEIRTILKDINFKLILLDSITQGQAETVLKAKDHIDYKTDLIIYNIDTYFKSDTLKRKLLELNLKKDGILGSFKSSGTNWSFAKTNSQGIVIETAEKIPISHNALTGFYHFSNPLDFISTAEYFISKEEKHKNEYYVAPMYNRLIQSEKKFVLDFVSDFIALGTPEEVEIFKNS